VAFATMRLCRSRSGRPSSGMSTPALRRAVSACARPIIDRGRRRHHVPSSDSSAGAISTNPGRHPESDVERTRVCRAPSAPTSRRGPCKTHGNLESQCHARPDHRRAAGRWNRSWRGLKASAASPPQNVTACCSGNADVEAAIGNALPKRSSPVPAALQPLWRRSFRPFLLP